MLSIFTFKLGQPKRIPIKRICDMAKQKGKQLFRMMRIEPTNMTFPIGKLRNIINKFLTTSK